MDTALYKSLYNTLIPIYDPQRASIAAQKKVLAGQTKAELSGLDQAKINAFKDITENSNTRGGYFSGFRPTQMAEYTGATYLPAVAKVKAAMASGNISLIDALNKIGETQSSNTFSLYNSELDRRTSAANAASKAGTSATDKEQKRQDAILKSFNTMFNAGKIGGRTVAIKGEELSNPNAYISREGFIRALAAQHPDLDPTSIAKEVYATYRG